MKNVLLLAFFLPALSSAQPIQPTKYVVEAAPAKQILDLLADQGVGPGCAMGRCQAAVGHLNCSFAYNGAGQLEWLCSYLNLDTNSEMTFSGDAAAKMTAHMGLAGIKLSQDITGMVYTSLYDTVCDYTRAMPESGRPESTTCVFTELE